MIGRQTAHLTERLVARHPRHAKFFARRFEGIDAAEAQACELLANDIFKLAGDRLDAFLDGYEFICKIQTEEELYFRRNKQYRLKHFKDALEQVYNNKEYMLAYMRGLLLTQIYWSNHTKCFGFYQSEFLSSLPTGAKLLEIGPGHGLLMARAIERLGEDAVTGWDISEASLEDTRNALKALGITKRYTLKAQNLFEGADEVFDAVVFSEVLEHLEEPAKALRAIARLLKPGGRLFVNVRINSPAPDHLFLLRSPEEAVAFTEECGLRVVRTGFFPATNYTMEQARKHALTVSVCLIAQPA